VFSPVLEESGDVLVDGGVMNNFPVDVMHVLAAGGPIIGVNVSPLTDKTQQYEARTSLSGWDALWQRLAGKPPIAPSIASNIMRSMEVNSLSHSRSSIPLADLLIQPEMGEYGLLDFAAYEPIVEAGYRQALPLLERWPHASLINERALAR
jgi:predicted acylesterase/phospholipase RssA